MARSIKQDGKINGSVRRIEKLAVLPIFFKLEGRRIIIAGGSEAAAWKAELLAACGAQVHIFAETLSNVFIEKITSKDSASSYIHHHESWDDKSFEGAALAICDADSAKEAARFFASGQKAGVPVNVIDKPDYCEFQFGSIVNRSPVIVSISTNGAAPILGQAIRQKIEILLPKSLSKWAQIGASLREFVADRLMAGSPRRLFWQKFSALAFGAAPDSQSKKNLRDLIGQIALGTNPDQMGKITFIHAPHDDAEMLSIKAVRALQSADVVLYGRGISNDILEFARREARHIAANENADDKLIELARSGKHVVQISRAAPDFALDDPTKLMYLDDGNTNVDIISGAGRYDVQNI